MTYLVEYLNEVQILNEFLDKHFQMGNRKELIRSRDIKFN